MSIELDKENIVLLEYLAGRKGISINSLLNQIVESYFQKSIPKDKKRKKEDNQFLKRMEELEITQEDIAIYLDVSQSSISRHINNISKQNKLTLAIKKSGNEDAFFIKVLKDKFEQLLLFSGIERYDRLLKLFGEHKYILGFILYSLTKEEYEIISFVSHLEHRSDTLQKDIPLFNSIDKIEDPRDFLGALEYYCNELKRSYSS